MHVVRVSITEFVSDDQPGWVRCSFADVASRQWQFVEKAPVVSLANLTAQSTYPQPGEIGCRVLSRSANHGRPTAQIDVSVPWGVESIDGNTVFEVFVDQLREVANVT